ncbi:MAG: hypothetical protein BroJett025_03120 [Patescibacteria group bacterium]|nr:MAG: hypothetical protein BroJett025_03120 [Patescibacteria group bacterium]
MKKIIVSPETRERQDNLLIADFRNGGAYANAVLFNYLVALAWHVARANPLIMESDGNFGKFAFKQIGKRDLALSTNSIPESRGFHKVYTPEVGEILEVCGFHGSDRGSFQIPVEVIEICADGRILVEVIPMVGLKEKKKLQRRRKLVPGDYAKLLQLGMSSSPALTPDNKVAGLLVAPAPGDFEGQRAYLEPATALLK